MSWRLLILAVWLCATLVFADRRAGLVFLLLGALFWVWTNIALGANGMLSLVLSLRALWSLKGSPARRVS